MGELEGKRVVVTGGASGIGAAAARRMAADGARIAILDIDGAKAEAVARELDGRAWTADVRDLVAVKRAMEEASSWLGGLDVLVNNAGSSRPVPWNATEEQWLEGMRLNFELVRRLTNEFIPTMRARRFGRIISITGANEPPGVNIASVAKAALHNWAKGLSRELAKDGITINCLPPGRINSEQILERLHPTPENRRAFIDANIPIGYFGEPEDMAYLVAFLASPLARYITGEVIHVDGGMHRFAG